MSEGPELPKCVYDAQKEGKAVVAVNGPALSVFGIDEFSRKRLVNLVRKRLAALDAGAVLVPVKQGFNLLVAKEAVRLGVPIALLDLVLTKRGRVERRGTDLREWAPENRELLKKLVRKASATVKVHANSFEYNAYLTDASSALLCAYDNRVRDPMLAHLVAYSDQMGVRIENLLPLWETMERVRNRASRSPIRVVPSSVTPPVGVTVVEIDSGALANPFGSEGVQKYEEHLRNQLADKASEVRKALLKAWYAAKRGNQVWLVTADPQEAVHGRILLGFLHSHLVPRSG